MAAAVLSGSTIASGASYQSAGIVPLPGGSGSVGLWTGLASATVTPTADWTAFAGTMAQTIADAGGNPGFTNPTLAALGAPDNTSGMALRGPIAGTGAAPITESITYTFSSLLPVGVAFLLWNPGGVGMSRFTFTAEGPGGVAQTAGWSFVVADPQGTPGGNAVTVNALAGVVSVIGSGAAEVPDSVVVVTPTTPLTEIKVTAQTTDANTWGLALQGEPQSATTPSSVACFLAGTAIMTPCGPVAVERLAPGDSVVTRFAGVARVAWIGRRLIEIAGHPNPDAVWPIRIRRDAVAAGVPCRDLLLSPDHAVFLGGVLIPVKYLVNATSIRQDRSFTRVQYLHVELDRHDVVLAEALPAESYLDTGNRGQFAPPYPPPAAPRLWERDACATLWGEGGPAEHVRAALAQRAGLRSHSGNPAPLRSRDARG